jgi:peptidoglycan/xylan/chitin deacetylase (PgdA/CDA1 family)
VLLTVVAALLVLLVDATSSGSGSASSPQSDGASHAQPPKAPTSRSHGAATGTHAASRVANVDDRAIDHVLAYTPFVRAGMPRHRVIALTFDDGPSPYTGRIVRILARMHVPATFFVVGQQLGDFAAGLRDELRHGFAVGDHTENHAYLTQLSPAAQYEQIHNDAVRLSRLGAPYPHLFRPPYGFYNAVTLGILRRQRMLMTLWSVDTRDWTRPGTRTIVNRALSAATPGGIVLMHDGGGDRSQTVTALPAIINGLRRRHYGFVTVPQLLRLDPPARGQGLPHVAE